MAFNGAGVFNRLYSWVQDAINGIKIRADRMDAEDNGFATGLTDCVTRDGQSPALANLPMGGFRHTGVQDGQAITDYASVNQLQNSTVQFAIAAGTPQAITANFTPAILVLVDGMELKVRAFAANTATAPTLSVNGLTAHPLTKFGGGALQPGDIFGLKHELLLRYNLANTRFELLNPYSSQSGISGVIASAATTGALTVPSNTGGLIVINEQGPLGSSTWVTAYSNIGGACALTNLASPIPAGTTDFNSVQASGAGFTITEKATGGNTNYTYYTIPLSF